MINAYVCILYVPLIICPHFLTSHTSSYLIVTGLKNSFKAVQGKSKLQY